LDAEPLANGDLAQLADAASNGNDLELAARQLRHVLHQQLADDHGGVGPRAEWPVWLVDLCKHGEQLGRTNAPILPEHDRKSVTETRGRAGHVQSAKLGAALRAVAQGARLDGPDQRLDSA
jgi:hypothetical protein